MNTVISQALVFNDQESMRHLAKFIAIWVRNELEDLHAENTCMNDKRMPEINTRIRNGIYSALYTLGNSPYSLECMRMGILTDARIPDYWEEPALTSMLKENFLSIDLIKMKFKSTFLNEQMELGNIYRLPNTNFIRTKLSMDFPDLPTAQYKKLLNKITSHLRKEGFLFDRCRDAYVKSIKLESVKNIL